MPPTIYQILINLFGPLINSGKFIKFLMSENLVE